MQERAKVTKLIQDNHHKSTFVEKLQTVKSYLNEKTEILLQKNVKLINENESLLDENDGLKQQFEILDNDKTRFKAFSFREQANLCGKLKQRK